jgi:hypothetical protein
VPIEELPLTAHSCSPPQLSVMIHVQIPTKSPVTLGSLGASSQCLSLACRTIIQQCKATLELPFYMDGIYDVSNYMSARSPSFVHLEHLTTSSY